MLRHLGVVGLMGMACLAMALSWQTVWVYPLLVAIGLLMLLVGRDRLDPAFYLLGLTFGAGIDVAQTGMGVTVYAAPAQLLYLPLFVFLYWGLSGVVVRHLYALMPGAEFHRADLGLFFGAIGLSLVANQAPEGVAIAMLALLVLRFGWIRRPYDLVAMLGGMLLGPVSESVLMSQGLYGFPSAHGAMVPAWLIALYGCLGVASRGLVSALSRGLTRLGQARQPAPRHD